MSVNLTALAPATTAASALSGLVLVSPQSTVGYQPQNPPNADGTPSVAPAPAAFLFDYEGEQAVMLESDITDHYVEDNTARQDQIALKPETYTTGGYVGELNDVPPFALQLLNTAADKLTFLTAYTPELTTTSQLAYSEAFQLYQVAANAANAAVSSWSSIANAVSGSNGQSVIGSGGLQAATVQNKQQTAFQQFYGYWRNRILFTVQTPWAVFQNMAIRSLRAIQDAETNVISSFEVTFKMIRQASLVAIGGPSTISGGQLNSQSSPLNDLGTSSPPSSISVPQGIASMA